ncbi:MAG TPA: hypothetical protein VE954_41790 [Oligoflexus sp.]|nr:hypothetical protein [Oligoflexus sp.]HYX39675.1 hypothetical protein [Oligoflexus sp.]
MREISLQIIDPRLDIAFVNGLFYISEQGGGICTCNYNAIVHYLFSSHAK